MYNSIGINSGISHPSNAHNSQGFSDKDLQLFKQTYRKITRLFYQNSYDESFCNDLLCLGELITQTIHNKNQSDVLSLISVIEILKVKVKHLPELIKNIDTVVKHLRNPNKNVVKYQTFLHLLRRTELFALGCTAAIRFYDKIISETNNFDWREIILELGKNVQASPSLCIELMFFICKESELHCKSAVKSGIVKYIFLTYTPSTLSDKYNLYKAIKLIKTIAPIQKNLLREKQKALATIIYTYEDYIPIVSEICSKCYDPVYSDQIGQKKHYDQTSIDQPYLWSYTEAFSQNNLSERTINILIQTLRTATSVQFQKKTLAILSNFQKYKKIVSRQPLKLLPKNQPSLLNFINFCINSVQNDQNCFELIRFQELERLVQKSSNAKVDQMFKYLKSMKNKEVKIGILNESSKNMFNMEKNADFMMERASKIPQNNEQLSDIKNILMQKERNNQFQTDTLKTVKQKALQSLQKSIIQRYKLDINIILNAVVLNDVKLIAKLLRNVQLSLMINPQLIEKINFKRILEMIQWLEENYNGELIDWGSIGQLLVILGQQKEWKTHLKEAPRKCYWLLSIQDTSQEQQQFIFNHIEQISSKMSKYPPKKIALYLGFLGKVLHRQLRAFMIKQHNSIINFVIQNCKQGKDYKTNLVMMSFFIKDWNCLQKSKEDEQDNQSFISVIEPLLKLIFQNFRSIQQQYEVIQNCLPYKLKVDSFQENIDYLVGLYGNLASYLYQSRDENKKKSNLSYDRIASIAEMPLNRSNNILQIIKFLQNNSEVVQSNELQRLLTKILNNRSAYWQIYPNFTTIINKLLQILGKTENNNIKVSISEMIIKLISHIPADSDISQQQKQQIYEQITECLKKLSKKGTKIQIQRIKKVVTKIVEEQIRENIIYILDNYQIIPEIKKTQIPQTVVSKKTEQQIIKVEPKDIPSRNNIDIQKKESISQKEPNKKQPGESPPKKQGIKKKEDQHMCATAKIQKIAPNIQDSRLKNSSLLIPSESKMVIEPISLDSREELDRYQNVLSIDDELKKLQKERKKSKSEDNLTVSQALIILKQITERSRQVSQFTRIYGVFIQNNLNSKQKDILGHLLVRFYPLERCQKVLKLLLSKEKTNLSREPCYQLLSKFRETFILSQRWKLVSHEWMALAMLRSQQDFLTEGCQVAEYNLLRMPQIEYFHSQKYHEVVLKLFNKVAKVEQCISYLLLVGTSARMDQIKKYYIANQLHLRLLEFVSSYSSNFSFVANISYALSSLAYLQPDICLQIARKKKDLETILASYWTFSDQISVIQSGACLIANLAYSNQQVKQILRQNKVVGILMLIFQKNLQNPESTTYKQLLRALGNLSLSKKCAMQIIDHHFCGEAVKMVQNMDIFVHFDDKKAKIIKILIDLVANLTAHKYKLQQLHTQKITLLILTILETTETNTQIITGCIDTIDGLCQNPEIQKELVQQKKLSYILLDVLKIQEDQKTMIKTARLITNLSLNQACIPFLLEANLLSVFANIILPNFHSNKSMRQQNKKLQGYIIRILTKIYLSNQPLKLILKSGYLDCLVRTIQTTDNEQQILIDILHAYSQHLPSFLNKRAFICLIGVLTRKIHLPQILDKCIKIFKNLLTYSYDGDEEDLVIEGIPQMYEKFLVGTYCQDALFLLSYHLLRSHKLRGILRKKQDRVFQLVKNLRANQGLVDICRSIIFLMLNPRMQLFLDETGASEEQSYKLLRSGIPCRLYRADGSSKQAIIDIDAQYNLRAYKYPDGQVKKKYFMNIRYLKDFQVDYLEQGEQWKYSTFNLENGGLFQSRRPVAENCCTLVGNCKWGEICFINIQFETQENKILFFKVLSNLLYAFRG